MNVINLFFTFFKIGLFTIGGGLASLPLLKEAVVDTGIISSNEFIDMIAISQSTPGPIGINMATYTGFKLASVPGSIAATAGIVMPSLIIIILISALMKGYASNTGVRNVLEGIRPAALGLIASAVWFIVSKAIFSVSGDTPVSVFHQLLIPELILLTAILIVRSVKPLSPVVYILLSAVAGVIFL